MDELVVPLSHPLTTAQEIIWIDQLLFPRSPRYNIGSSVRLEGELDLECFELAIQQAARRYDALRLVMVSQTQGGLPHQVLLESVGSVLERIDLSTHDDPEACARSRIAQIFDTPFEKFDQPLWRFVWIGVGRACGYWVLCFHHLIADGTSVSLIGNAVMEIYGQLVVAGCCDGTSAPSYLEYATSDRLYRASPRYEKDRDFWLAHLPEAPPPVFARPAQAATEENCGVLQWRMPRTTFADIEAVAAASGCSATHFFMAMLAVYFSRVGDGREQLPVGMPVHNRSGAAQKRTAGMFTSQIPVVLDVGANSTFVEMMRAAAGELRRCYRHQRFPLAELNRHFGVGAGGSGGLFDIYFSLEQFPGDSDVAGLRTAVFNHGRRHTGSPLSICVGDHERDKAVGINFFFDRNVLSEAEVSRHRRRIEMLTGRLLREPAMRIGTGTLLDPAERRCVLERFNATARAYPRDLLLHQLFEQQVARTPESTALVFETERLSYVGLNARANRLAAHLLEAGVGADARVALCLQRSVAMVVALLATLKAGGAYVPLDPALPAQRLQWMLDDASPRVLLVDAEGRRALGEAALSGRRVVDVPADDAAWRDRPDRDPAVAVSADCLAYVIYTSGSTGLPKGAMNSHRGVVNRLLWMQEAYGLVPGVDRVLQKTPFSFDVSVWEFFWPLMAGAELVLARPEGQRDPAYLCETIRRMGITTLHFVPSMLQRFLESDHAGACNGVIGRVICSGEALPAALARRFHTTLPDVELHNLYGPTEAAVDVTAWHCRPSAIGDTVPIGRPIANTRIYVLDPAGQPLPVGVAGEIHIGGVQVARGYLNRPELTAGRFIRDPFSDDPDARLYRSGDLGRWREDGVIEYLGRNDFQVKIRGFRIELGEVEARLAQLPGVRQAVVLAREDAPGDRQLVAYIAAERDRALEPALLRRELAAVLPDYMVPAAIVQLPELPLTSNGKLDRRALPAPAGDAFARSAYEPPQGGIEETLADIWSALLGRERIGRDDSFFALGGHSLLAVQLVSQLRQRLGIELPLSAVFVHPVLRELAAAAAQAACSDVEPIPLADRSQPLPLSWAQQRLWLIARMDSQAGAAYHLAGGLRLRGVLDEPALRCALNRLIERHEILRTCFVVQRGQPVQKIDPPSAMVLLRHELFAGGDATLDEIIGVEAKVAFDLEAGPLMRGRLLRLAPDHHVLLLTLHHLVADGWSVGLLVRELSELYSAFVEGRPDPLPPLPLQYADYAVWQRQWLQGAALQTQLQYWVDHLRGAPEQVSLPMDRPRPNVQDYRGETIDVELDADLTRALKKLSQRHGTTLYMTLLSAWAATVSRLSGQEEVVIGSPVAGRPRAELESLIGLFVNTQALRIDLSSEPTVAELLTQVRDIALAAQQHQDIPFEQVVEALNPTRSLAHSPLFQLMFAWQNTPEATPALDDLDVEPLAAPYRSAQFDLTLDLREENETIRGSLTFATALFDRTTIERHWRCLHTMLRGMVAEPDSAIGAIGLLDAEERQRVIFEFNRAEHPPLPRLRIHEQIERQARSRPQAPAVVCGSCRLTFGELNARANRLARYLRRQGVGPAQRVALCLRPGADFVVALLATLKAGAAYVPIDPTCPGERLGYLLRDSAPALVIADAVLPGSLQPPAGAMPATMPVLAMQVGSPLWEGESAEDLCDIGLVDDHPAYVIYTSGSTGRPKAVQVQYRGLRNLLGWYLDDLGFCADNRLLLASSIGFDLTQKNLLAPLMAGAPLYLADTSHNASFEPRKLLSLIEREGIDWLNLAPSAFYALLEADERHCLSGLRCVVLGGEPIRIDRLLRIPSPRPRFVNSYGPTECSDVVACHVLHEPLACYRERGVPLGRPIRNSRLYVLDRYRQPVPVGVTGELCIGGVGVADGYPGQPGLTAERFIADPINPGARLYRSGDLARWNEAGELEYLGRNDFQVKIRGIRIEPAEVEAQLAQLPGVRETAVIAWRGEDTEAQLVAYVVAESADLDPVELRRALLATLPGHLVPAAFVQLRALPLTPNGKLDRRALPPPDSAALARHAYQPPVGPAETLLAGLWAELLKLDRIGRHDNFFALGGHSLLAVTLLERLREHGLTVPVRTFFESPTLAALAQALMPDGVLEGTLEGTSEPDFEEFRL